MFHVINFAIFQLQNNQFDKSEIQKFNILAKYNCSANKIIWSALSIHCVYHQIILRVVTNILGNFMELNIERLTFGQASEKYGHFHFYLVSCCWLTKFPPSINNPKLLQQILSLLFQYICPQNSKSFHNEMFQKSCQQLCK